MFERAIGKRVGTLLSMVLAAAVAAGLAAPSGAAAKFGPTLEQCGKVKKKAAKRACKKRNADTRKVFAQIRDSRFTGTLFDGVTIDATFCANGRWAVTAGVPGGPVEFSGPRWKLSGVFVTTRGKGLLAGTATGPSDNVFTRVHVQRRGKAWFFSDGNPSLAAPAATKAPAADHCRTL